MIGIIGAMKIETAALAAAVEDAKTEVVSGITYTVGRLDGQMVVIATCGIGKVYAAMCAQTMILRYHPDVVINTGVAGTLTEALGIGDVAVATTLCQHDMDTSPIGDPVGLVSGINKIYFEADPQTSNKLASCVEASGSKTLAGCIASGDQFVATPEKKQYIKETFGAIACEMEGGAIAHVATVNGTPFAVLRAISDSADGDATMDYPTFARMAAERSVATLRAYLRTL
jgi:adenosylhomocysteine nucleosidase